MDDSTDPTSTGDPGRILLVIAVASMAVFSGQFVLSPLLPTIIETLSITPSQAGIALSVMWGLVALSRFPGGRLADHLSRKTVLVAAFGVLIVGFALLGAVRTYLGLLIGAAAVGLGSGLYMPAAIALLSETFVERRGRAFGVNEIAINLGGVAAGVIAVAVLALTVWTVAFVPVMVALGVVTLLMHRWGDEPYVTDVSGIRFDVRGTGARLVGNARVLAVLIAFGVMAFTWQGLSNFLPTFLQLEKGFDPAIASNAFTGLFVVGIAANLLVTPLGDRLGHARTAASAAALSAVGLGLVVTADAIPIVAVGIAAFGFGAAAFWPLMTAYVTGLLPDASMGGDYGAISTAFMAVGSLGPTYVGVVAERLSYTVAFAGLVGCVLLGCGLTVWLSRVPTSTTEATSIAE